MPKNSKNTKKVQKFQDNSLPSWLIFVAGMMSAIILYISAVGMGWVACDMNLPQNGGMVDYSEVIPTNGDVKENEEIDNSYLDLQPPGAGVEESVDSMKEDM